jgi:hypothetical protein
VFCTYLYTYVEISTNKKKNQDTLYAPKLCVRSQLATCLPKGNKLTIKKQIPTPREERQLHGGGPLVKEFKKRKGGPSECSVPPLENAVRVLEEHAVARYLS